jgi:hypothetical protein
MLDPRIPIPRPETIRELPAIKLSQFGVQAANDVGASSTANRRLPRIKSGAGFRRKMLQSVMTFLRIVIPL